MVTIGFPFTELASIDSTNNYAMAMAHEGLATHGAAFFAHEQTAGKGQLGRQWKTTALENIMLSIVLKPSGLPVTRQFFLSAAIAAGCYDFYKKYAIDDVAVKWPNDIYWRDRKAGGILIENVLAGNNWQFAIVGIGININQTVFAEGVANPVSLKQITGKTFATVEMAKELCNCLQKRYELLFSAPLQETLENYNAILYKRGEKVKLRKDIAVFETIIKGVNENGKLMTVDTMEREFSLGEVSLVV